MNFNKKVRLLILISLTVRLWIAGTLELGNDEVYYQTYAQHLQWNYFDHPPLLALLIRITTINLFFHKELFIRLGPILCAALGTWLIYSMGKRIRNERTGWIAALLYNTSFYASIIAGTFILPDSPQSLFWLFSMYCMILILEKPEFPKPLLFILLGIGIGLSTMSKVHGLFLWLGFFGYIIFHRRRLMKSPWFWISIIISLVIISPIYYWNHSNQFITYTYHQGRIRFFGNSPDPDHFFQQVFGSVFYSNPVNFIIYLLALYALLKHKIKFLPDYFPIFPWLSLPLIILLLWISLFNETLPHWSGPAYYSIMLITACYFDGKDKPSITVKWLKASAWTYCCIVLLGVAFILFLPFRIGSKEIARLGKGDITLDLIGWKSFSASFDSLYQSDLLSGKMKSSSLLISDYWFPAGHLDHYLGIPYHHNLIAMGPLNNIHHFAWLNAKRPRITAGSDAYFIYPTNYYGPPAQKLKNTFAHIEDSILIPQYRAGIPVRYFVVYRMHNFRGDSTDYLIPGIQ